MKHLNLRFKHLKIFVFIIGILFLLIFISTLILRKVIEGESLREKIITEINKKTDVGVNFEKIEIFLIPTPHIRIYEGAFSIDKNFKTKCNFQSAEIYPEIIPLLKKKLQLDSITVNKPELLIKLPGKTRETPDIKKTDTPSLSQLEEYYKYLISASSNLHLIELEINNGEISIFEDEEEVLNLKEVDTSFQSSKKSIEFEFSGNSTYAKLTEIKAEISSTDLNAEAELNFEELDPHYLSGVFLKDSIYRIDNSGLDLELRIKIDGPGEIRGDIELPEFSLNLFNKDQPFNIRGKNVSGTFHIDKDNRKYFSIKEAKFTEPEMLISGELLIDNNEAKSSLNFTGKDVGIKSVRNTALSAIGQFKITEKIFRILKSGRSESIEFHSESVIADDLFKHENFVIKGQVKDGEIYDPDLDLTLDDIKGDVMVKNGKLFVKKLSGKTGNTTFDELTGNYEFGKENKLEISYVNTRITVKDLYNISFFEKFAHYLENYKQAKGTINIRDFQLSKDITDSKKWDLSFKSDGTIYDDEKIIYSLNFLKTPEILKIENLNIKDDDSDAVLSLEFKDESYKVDFSGRLVEKTAGKYLKDKSFSFRSIDGDIKINYLKNDNSKSSAAGSLKGDRIVIPYQRDNPFRIKDFSLTARGNTINIEKLGLSVNERDIMTTGRLYSSGDKLNVELDASTGELAWTDLSKYFGNTEDKEKAKKKKESKKFPLEAVVKFNISKFNYNNHYLTPLEGDIIFGGETVNINVRKSSLCKILTSGNIGINKRDLIVDFDAFSENNKIEDTLICLFEIKERINGDYNFNANIYGEGNKKKIKENLNGDFELIIKDGQVSNKNPVLLSILKVTNITEIYRGKIPNLTSRGLDFASIKIKGFVKDGVIKFKDASLDSPYMGILFGGEISLVDETYNLKFNVVVLKTLQDVIKKVPIVKRIKTEKLLSIPVRVKGVFNKPETIESFKE